MYPLFVSRIIFLEYTDVCSNVTIFVLDKMCFLRSDRMTKLFKRYEHEIEEILEKQHSEFLPGNPNETDLS